MVNEKVSVKVNSDEFNKFIEAVTSDKPSLDGYEVYKVLTKKDKILKRIAELESELVGMKEPTEEELIQEGHMMHIYYMLTDELVYLTEALKILK